jgi:flagellar hook protein FlgE
MLRSLFSAISGLQAHQTKMDVVGNNIANVNTVGYKSQSTVFEDTLSQMLRNGSAPTATTAGTNPAQVGLGTKVADIATNFSQGSTQSTGRSTDFLISGDGFFVTKSGNQQLYTRAGSFDFDAAGRLVTPDGNILQGWMPNAAGKVDTNGPIVDLSVPMGQTLAPQATTDGAITGNLSANAKVNDAVQTQVTMYDAQGAAHQVSYVLTNTAPNSWKADITTTDATGAPVTLVSGAAVSFDPATGKITGPTVGTPAKPGLQFTPNATTFPAWPGPVTIDLGNLSQYGGTSAVSSTPPTTGTAGSAMGTLQSITLGDDGTITGVFSNGLRKAVGQLALANFANPNGLIKAGNSSYAVGDNSGTPDIGVAGSGGRGTLQAGALEMSNVDLSQEFTGLIIAQRGFQANSKVITTSDQILNDLVNMKQ